MADGMEGHRGPGQGRDQQETRVADYSHGQIVEVLIANRLSAPQPLYAFHEWAEDFAVNELLGIDPLKLNDDRLGRALDAISDQLEGIQGSVSIRAIRVFDLKLEQVHIDITSFMFEGAYANDEEEFPQVTRGYNAEKDLKRRQVRTGLGVLKDGNVPIFSKAFDGNRTDSNTLMRVYEGFEGLRKQAKAKDLVYVGGSKLLASGNLLTLLRAGVQFVGPGERGKDLESLLLRLDPDAWKELEHASETEFKRRKNGIGSGARSSYGP
jgi:hypothetical protein